jgi:putative protease
MADLAAVERRSDAEAVPPSSVSLQRLPELLAPAGDWDCAKAAVENGADAIYFALDKFNARIRAQNFTEGDLPGLLEFLHRRGVRGYACLNTLVFENEMADAEQQLRAMITAGADAVLVQDVGIARLVRQVSPDFPMHASTQMTITSAAGVEFARELGCDLVVLARELSLKDIGNIQSALGTRHSAMPLEVFVHGALCVAYSGQCLTSEALGGRSANRGECAQACRMPYELICDSQAVPLGDRRYLLSPQDLAGLELLPDLLRTGVASLKIEGRLKTPEYVANITRMYRRALDSLVALAGNSRHAAPEIPRYEMEMAFSRGLHTGWLRGIDNQKLVHGRFGKKRGVYLGKITGVLRDAVAVRLDSPLKPGDGVVFDAGKPEEKEEGGRVYEVRLQPAAGIQPAGSSRGNQTRRQDARSTQTEAELRFGRCDVNFQRIRAGDKLWKTDDPELNARLRQTFTGDMPKFQRPIGIEVRGSRGEPLTLVARDEKGHAAKAESAMPLAHAEKRPLSTEVLRKQLGRLGGTPFRLGVLKNLLAGEVMLPLSELNRLRREAVAELERLRAQPKRWTLTERGKDAMVANVPSTAIQNIEPRVPNLIVLVRNLAQLQVALKCGAETIYCDFENPKRYREAVRLFHTARDCSDSGASVQPAAGRPSIWVAPPRIFKPGEEWILSQVRSCGAEGYLVRNYDHLKFFANDHTVGDYTLNVANRLAADYFKTKFGVERLTASYDLNIQQLEALLQAAPPDWFEVTIHQHMPMFHMEHCVFCAFLTNGTDYTNCGRPCDICDVKLRDRAGAEHPVKADAGCRNTVYNALAQTGAEYVSRMIGRGVRHFRIEFLDETPEQVAGTIAKYRQLLREEISGPHLWRELKLLNQLSVTRGQMAGSRG